MKQITVIKKDQSTEPFTADKIITAVTKAATRCDINLSDEQHRAIVAGVFRRIENPTVTVLELHELVIGVLNALGHKTIAESYAEYRYYKTNYAKTFEKLHQEADDVLHLGDRENANFDSSLVSTKGSLIKGYLTKSLYKQFYLTKREKELIKRGDIYIHDLRDMILGSINCCLFDMETLLKDGFEMSNVSYTEPKSVLSALQVIGDVTLVASAQQFGGFTIAELDKVLLPYTLKSFKAYQQKYERLGLSFEKAVKQAEFDTIRELEQGFQSLELKLNTVPSSRGDFAFTTVTFGQWDATLSKRKRHWMSLIGQAILKVRRNGHGKNGKMVVFPKLVYLYDKEQIATCAYSSELFEEAVKTSAQCLYPDYLSLTSDYGSVSELYFKTGVITSPMGCRAYLTPWQDPETGKYVTIGRCNIGASSLNVPLLISIAKKEYPETWKTEFWNILGDRMDVIRSFLKKRYDVIRNQKCSSNPLAFTQGGFYRGTKNPDDKVGDLVDYMTASFGITALDEATYLWTGKRLIQGNEFAIEVLKFMQERIAKYKAEDGYLYAIYGVPAESLGGTQADQYAKWCEENGVENVFEGHEHYDRAYFSNSFHINVTEDITPIEKQMLEFKGFHNCEGGHITYCRIDNPENLKALKAIITHGMELGYYQGINFDAAVCNDCGKKSTNVLFECPHCGSKNISVVSRVCGYLAYSNVNGSTRMNDSKMAEIKRRKSM